jgi:hypothetical protein
MAEVRSFGPQPALSPSQRAMSSLLPPASWFRLAVTCRRFESIPRNPRKGRLLDLPDSCRLPELPRLSDLEPWAEVRSAWNPRGLAVQVEVRVRSDSPPGNLPRPNASAALHLWIDTRDTRSIHRATRFCHHYAATLAASGSGLAVDIDRRPIPRASAEPTAARPETIHARAERSAQRWLLELFFPPTALDGFDPETNRRLGFHYLVSCPSRGEQPLIPAPELPITENPSLWPTLELSDLPA